MKKHRTSTNLQDGENHMDDLSLNGNEFAGMRQFSYYETEIDNYLKDTDFQALRKTLFKVNAKFRKAEKEHSVITFKPVYKRAYVYAIAATIALIIGVYTLTRFISSTSESSNTKLYTEYYQPYQSDYILRSDQLTINNLYLAFQAYENHDYNKAVDLFSKVINADESITIAFFYKGISCIETNNLSAAIESFNKVLINEANPYYPQAQWYLALTMLKQNKPLEAKQHLSWLVSNDRFYGKKAKELLEKLNN